VEDAVYVLQRLPKLVAQAEEALARLAEGGVKLHPDTMLAFERRDRRNRHHWIGWTVAAALIVLAIALMWSH
jgi:hypothetical protein